MRSLSNQIPVILLLFIVIQTGCAPKKKSDFKIYEGKVFGTYYRFKINSDKDFSEEIDSIFEAINFAANSYFGESEIILLNRTGFLSEPSPTFLDMLHKAEKYYITTDGYFNPAVSPLLREWKTGLGGNPEKDSVRVTELLKLINFKDNISLEEKLLEVKVPGTELDLSAMGEGYALDAVSFVLDKNGIENYLLEIGGEINCNGRNENGNYWRIGIESPYSGLVPSKRIIIKNVVLKNQCLSTSGSYRKFYEDQEGEEQSHIINPKTGYPINHNLVSVSIISKSSTTADVISTACMAMGVEKAKNLLTLYPQIEGFLIMQENEELKTWSTPGFFN